MRVVSVSLFTLGMAVFLSRYTFGLALCRPADGMILAPMSAAIFALDSRTESRARWAYRAVVFTIR